MRSPCTFSPGKPRFITNCAKNSLLIAGSHVIYAGLSQARHAGKWWFGPSSSVKMFAARILPYPGTQRTKIALGIPFNMIKRYLELPEGRQLEWLVNSAAEGMLVVDREGRIILANTPLLHMFGYSNDELIENPIEMLLPESIRHGHVAQRGEYLEQPVARAMGSRKELFARRHDGTTFPVEVSLSPLKTEKGVPLVMATVHDITRRKQAEDENARLMQEISSANEELTSFAYVVSHDLKAPLRAIGSLANWLSTDYADKFDEEGKEHMRLLVSRVHRMAGLIDGILLYSRVGRVKEAVVDVDLGSVVRDVVDALAPPSHIIVTIASDLPTIKIEPTRIEQVFQNLISNAIKYMDKPEGKIHIDCVSADKFWRFTVSDNGPGIEQRHFERIFQLFQTLAPRDRVESTGVGLALVKKIVEMYGGQVSVESTPGLGSNFSFTLRKHNKINIKQVEKA
jgi:two-component system sensor kinase FixL